MSKPGEDFIPLLPTQKEKPKSHFYGPAALQSIIRDQFTIQTWLAFGAAAQAVLYVAVGAYAFVPVTFYLLLIGLETALISTGLISNPYMKGVIPKKFSAQIPDASGNYGSKPADTDIVVFLIGARSNHPLGVLAPGMPTSAKHFENLAGVLEDHADEFGFLGMTSWFNYTQRSTKSDSLYVCYFRTVEGLHAFAHSSYHREAWNWWNTSTKKYPHLSIYHETYHVPKGHWENIYINSYASGITSTTTKVVDKETGEERWASPVVDASKGLLKTSASRMARSHGGEHEEYGEDPYQRGYGEGWKAEALSTQ
ncbi:hypothetical protein CB0940_06767 [Cercospora beticola]|uniref:Monooxygenase n=1 Tax=Cercospora beticola TaxID=122368 RepID=A0A2G5H7G1_CERBT|nr:hypothetical protein CB0940_06767 [Cercospora beticola]PIA88476.1 hypothetical protein CB0940_06767 [Cercospora beticola]WPB02679.1 hypothetical protein RHO25_007315 [Cercospora beticola]CAK1358652.1 unnamed protein product [Cercospora beticola]